jgi:BASS family bile acid:Na+ symporter
MLENILLLVPVLLQWLLFAIMLFMGMTLTIDDFKRVAVYPKAVGIGLMNQIIFLPLIGLAIVNLIPLEAAFAVGIMVVSASPGGAVSNLISHLSKGDTALSISLTAFSSVLTIFTIPFIINWSLAHLAGTDGVSIQLPLGKTIFNIFKLTVLPVIMGMAVNHFFPKFTARIGSIIAWVSGAIIIIALALIYVKLDEIGDVFEFVKACFLSVLILNIATLAIGYFSARWMGLNIKQSITTSIETGMQNNVLGMAIATSPSLLNNSLMAVPAGVYGLLMCTTATFMIFYYRRLVK